MNIGNTLKKIRKELKLTQVSVCEKANIEQAYLCQVENNKITPSISMISKICEIYTVPVFFIFVLASEDKDIDAKHLEKWIGNRQKIYDIILKTFNTNDSNKI